ncbi:MAG: hypothetical protein J0L80_01855 [Chitinophagales bacterium]|nr:hypothetical protein [Chitinophagales bacterium]
MDQINNAGDRYRRARIELRVTVAEKAKLMEACMEGGLNISDWIRYKALGLEPLHRKPNPDREILLRYLAMYGRICSLLNQAVRQMNRKQYSDEYEIPIGEIHMLVDEFKNLSAELREELQKR